MNIIQIGCHAGGDHVHDFIKHNASNIETCVLIDANPNVMESLRENYSQFSFCKFRNLAVLPIETKGYEIDLFYPACSSTSQICSTNREFVVKHAHTEDILSYKVPTISLNSLLKEYPKTDILFIDTEGLDAINLLSVNFSETNLKQIIFEYLHTDGIVKYGTRLNCLIEYLRSFGYHVEEDMNSEYNLTATLCLSCRDEASGAMRDRLNNIQNPQICYRTYYESTTNRSNWFLR